MVLFDRQDGIADDLKWLFRTAEITHLECLGLQVVDGAIRHEGVSVPEQPDVSSQDNFVRGRIVLGVIAIDGHIGVTDNDISFRHRNSALKSGLLRIDFNWDYSGFRSALKRQQRIKRRFLGRFFLSAGLESAAGEQALLEQTDLSAARAKKADLESGAS